MPICCFLRYLFLLLLLLLLLPTNSISLSRFPNLQQQNLLSVHRPEPNTELVVDRGGKVFLMQQSGIPIWSFSSGSPIHSSYQAPHATSAIALEYLDDNSEADDDDGYLRQKVGLTMEELLRKIPVVTHDGAVTLASKETITYLVDAISGRLIHVYKSGDDDDDDEKKLTTSSENSVKLSLFIKRTDSKLEYFDKTTRKLAWNVSVSRFNAELHCDPVFNAGDELGPEILTGVYLPLQCGSQGTEVRAFIEPQLFIKVDGELLLRSWLPDTA